MKYQKAEGMACGKCNSPIYHEHCKEIDYPFYCKNCDENLYSFEAVAQKKENAKAEFYQLREDDKDFAEQYAENEFEDWYKEQGKL